MKPILICLACLALPLSLSATSFRPLSDREKFESAEFICAGKVLSVKTITQDERHSTVASVEILDCAKGNISGKPVEVQWPGGSEGRSRTLIPGVVYLQVNEVGVLYLHYNPEKKIYQLQAWQVDRLQEVKSSHKSEWVFQDAESLSSRRQKSQQEVRTWKKFKEKVRKELTESP